MIPDPEMPEPAERIPRMREVQETNHLRILRSAPGTTVPQAGAIMAEAGRLDKVVRREAECQLAVADRSVHVTIQPLADSIDLTVRAVRQELVALAAEIPRSDRGTTMLPGAKPQASVKERSLTRTRVADLRLVDQIQMVKPDPTSRDRVREAVRAQLADMTEVVAMIATKLTQADQIKGAERRYLADREPILGRQTAVHPIHSPRATDRKAGQDLRDTERSPTLP